jgi:hypothetical protein
VTRLGIFGINCQQAVDRNSQLVGERVVTQQIGGITRSAGQPWRGPLSVVSADNGEVAEDVAAASIGGGAAVRFVRLQPTARASIARTVEG